jgi:hypothetical protein
LETKVIKFPNFRPPIQEKSLVDILIIKSDPIVEKSLERLRESLLEVKLRLEKVKNSKPK